MPARRTRDESEDVDSSDFTRSFHDSVHKTVRKIPEGKVASYGTIAKLIGFPKHSRMVGGALKVLPSSLSSPYLPPAPRSTSSTTSSSSSTVPEEEYIEPAPQLNPDLVPWWRVVSSTGVISPRGNDRAVQRQADYLVAEGVVVRDGARDGGGGGRGGQRGNEGNIAARGGVDAFGLGGAGGSGGRVSMTTYGWKG